jgi:hypothetical protein
MLTQRIGNFPQVTASSPISKELRALKPRHTLLGLQLRVSATLTAAGATGPFTSGDLDTIYTTIVSRFRIFGGANGDQVNISTTNLRSLHWLATGQDWTAIDNTSGSALLAFSIGNGVSKAVTIDMTIPFTEEMTTDPDWCSPSTDQLRWESQLEVSVGTLAATAALTGGGTITASAVTIEIVALMVDAHELYIAPTMVMREQAVTSDNQVFEAMLALQLADTRAAIGSGAYQPTYIFERDGKPLLDSVGGLAQALAYLKRGRHPGGIDPTTRVGPIVFGGKGYGVNDLKPAFGNVTLRTPVSFTAGQVVMRYLKPVQNNDVAKLANFEGVRGPVKLVARPVLDVSPGVVFDDRPAAYFPKFLKAG